jgi:hypothetical protein
MRQRAIHTLFAGFSHQSWGWSPCLVFHGFGIPFSMNQMPQHQGVVENGLNARETTLDAHLALS